MPRTLLLVDLTNIAVRCSLGGPVPPATAAGTACNMIARVARAIAATHLVCATDHPAPSWRRELAPDYKAGRGLDTTPYSEAAADEARRRGWLVYSTPGYEADDEIATLTERAVVLFDVVIYSGDSDVEALARPGTDLHGSVTVAWPKPGGAWELRDAVDVRARHQLREPAQLTDLKAIAGEPGDNVAGLGGRTPAGKVSVQLAKAQKLLAAYGSLDEVLAAGERNDSREAREAWLASDRLTLARKLVALCTDVPLPQLSTRACALPPITPRTAEEGRAA